MSGLAAHGPPHPRSPVDGGPVSESEKQTQASAEQPQLTWRVNPADPSVEGELARAQAGTIREVLTWWANHAARSHSMCSTEGPTAADPQD